jgi:hypothetical protein
MQYTEKTIANNWTSRGSTRMVLYSTHGMQIHPKPNKASPAALMIYAAAAAGRPHQQHLSQQPHNAAILPTKPDTQPSSAAFNIPAAATSWPHQQHLVQPGSS